jgi:hypothetical protein
MSNIYNKECEASEYSQCYGYKEEVDVIFKYRTKRGSQVPDEVVKVCFCGTHSRVLKDIHQGEPLEMRGEVPQYALHDDLLQPLANKERMYTLLEVESYVDEVKEVKYCLINGRDTEKFRKLIIKETSAKGNAEWTCVREDGFFLTCLKPFGVEGKYIQSVVEVVDIHGEMVLEALAKGLTTFYKPLPEGEMRNISESALSWFPRVEENPTLITEYTCEPIPEFIRTHFLKKQAAEKYAEFEECCYFIDGEIDKNIVDWQKIRKNSSHDEKSLFETVSMVTEALQSEDEMCRDVVMINLGDDAKISEDVLWVTYVLANHELYYSRDPKKKLYESTRLIEEFIFCGLEKDLLALAISGERMRWLSRKQRDHHDILETNKFVVEYLVPKYVKGTDIIYTSEHAKLTPLEYWHYYDNTTSYIGGGFCCGRDTTEVFEKDMPIHDYLLMHTPANEKQEVVEEEPVIVQEEPAVEKPEFGSLDVTLLKGASLEYYNKIVVENGHPESEFVILGFPFLFEQIYTSTIDGKEKTMEYTESLFPGITEMYEQKKRDLRKNDYEAWKFVNEKLRKNL